MARIRYLKPEFFSDEDLAELPFQTRITFAGLWCFADKAGRLEDRPKYLKAMIFPYDNVDMEKQIELLGKGKHENGIPFIQRYEVEGLKFIQIVRWDKHQKPHHTEKESIFPPAPPLNIKIMGKIKQLEASAELDNVERTVSIPLLKPDENFEIFWKVYPKKKNKGYAEKAWQKIKPNKELTELMISKIEQLKQTNQWLEENGKYIPFPSTWLNARGWEDEIVKENTITPIKEIDKSPTWMSEAIDKGWKT